MLEVLREVRGVEDDPRLFTVEDDLPLAALRVDGAQRVPGTFSSEVAYRALVLPAYPVDVAAEILGSKVDGQAARNVHDKSLADRVVGLRQRRDVREFLSVGTERETAQLARIIGQAPRLACLELEDVDLPEHVDVIDEIHRAGGDSSVLPVGTELEAGDMDALGDLLALYLLAACSELADVELAYAQVLLVIDESVSLVVECLLELGLLLSLEPGDSAAVGEPPERSGAVPPSQWPAIPVVNG